MIRSLLANFRPPAPLKTEALSEKDAILITYGDSFQRQGERPLRTLDSFLREAAGDLINGVHILPFYPFSSDDGFSVIDYRKVDPRLGDWGDNARIGEHKRLMFDGVINHISRQSEWFARFQQGQPPYSEYFITPAPDWDLTMVARPRTLPLLTEVITPAGPRKVWTTFSDDQVDLNYSNPNVLIEMVDLLLFYVAQGAGVIRLDAIAYLWKEPGTNCLHRPQAHAVVKLLRAVLDLAAPHVLLITETNVPHQDNISYFGEVDPVTGRTDEAQMVYQFPLAPLVLHTFRTGSAETLSQWAAGLEGTSGGQRVFFNFLASHDGIGLLPALGILSTTEMQALVDNTRQHGGQVSYRSNPDGSQSPYELNITLYDALNDPATPRPEDIDRFMAAQAILLSLAGVPGIYVHSLFGSHNWLEGMQKTGRARTINRAWFDYPRLAQLLEDPDTREARVFSAFCHLLALRRQQPAFHPLGRQVILDCGAHIFTLERVSPDGKSRMLCLVNVSSSPQSARLDRFAGLPVWQDLVSGKTIAQKMPFLELELAAYQVMWLVSAI
jgi:sucrose phosphorylase